MAVVAAENMEVPLDLAMAERKERTLQWVADETMAVAGDVGEALGFKEGDYVGLWYDGKEVFAFLMGEVIDTFFEDIYLLVSRLGQ